jgi:hypothetical protein
MGTSEGVGTLGPCSSTEAELVAFGVAEHRPMSTSGCGPRSRTRRHRSCVRILDQRHGPVRRPDPRPRVINSAVKAEIKTIFDESLCGKFAEEWIAEAASGRVNHRTLQDEGAAHRSRRVCATGAP